MKAGITALLFFEVLAGTIGLLLVARKRKLQDVLVYAALAFVAVLVTGIVGEALVSATLEQMSSYNRPLLRTSDIGALLSPSFLSPPPRSPAMRSSSSR